MHYRRWDRHYAKVVRSGQAWPLGDMWQSDRLCVFVPSRWRPEADTFETSAEVRVVVDLAGVDEGDFEVQLFRDALVIEGHRQLPASGDAATYHAAGIRQGPFLLEVALPVILDHERVEAHYDRGLLVITLPKRAS